MKQAILVISVFMVGCASLPQPDAKPAPDTKPVVDKPQPYYKPVEIAQKACYKVGYQPGTVEYMACINSVTFYFAKDVKKRPSNSNAVVTF